MPAVEILTPTLSTELVLAGTGMSKKLEMQNVSIVSLKTLTRWEMEMEDALVKQPSLRTLEIQTSVNHVFTMI